MTRIRIGIIGGGRMGVTHSCILKTDERVKVSSVADPSWLLRWGFQRHIKVHAFKSYGELLDRDRPDALVVCTPPHLHHAIAVQAMRQGAHVFVEKPCTVSYPEAENLCVVAAETGVVNQVGYVNRFNDVFRQARRMVAAGVIGELVEVRSTMLSGTVLRPAKEKGWRAKASTGGGVVFEMASHAIDLLQFFAGPFTQVTNIEKRRIFSEYVPDAMKAEIATDAGLRGIINVNWSDPESRKPTNKVELIGSAGSIAANQHGMHAIVSTDFPEFGLRAGSNELEIPLLAQRVHFYLRGNEYTEQLVHFIDRIVGKVNESTSTFADSARTLKLLTTIDGA